MVPILSVKSIYSVERSIGADHYVSEQKSTIFCDLGEISSRNDPGGCYMNPKTVEMVLNYPYLVPEVH